MAKIVPLTPPDAGNTERTARLFAWAAGVLKQIGAEQAIQHARTLAELRRISLDVENVEVTLAIRDALHPSSGERSSHFRGLNEGSLKRILRNRFDDMKQDRAEILRRGGARRDWTDTLVLNKEGNPTPVLANLILILRESPKWKGVLAYDEFALVTTAMLPPPWLQGLNTTWEPTKWTDRDDVLAADWLQHNGIGVAPKAVSEAIEAVAKDKPFHPIRDYLNGLKWDGKKRVARVLPRYFGTEDNAYHRAIGKATLISAVARVMQPGCKADHVLLLEGPQGALKSSAIEALATPWFSDDLAELGTKDAAMQMRQAWIIEIPELSAMNRTEIERTKASLSRRVDRFRPPYGRRVIEVPRHSISIGSTNADTYLRDETGARRFWPAKCGKIRINAVKRYRDQLWAEAVWLYREGAKWWLDTPATYSIAVHEQEERRVKDAWEPKIADFIDDRDDVTVGEILGQLFMLEASRWTQADQNRVVRCLIALGWERGWRHEGRCYRPGDVAKRRRGALL